MWRRVSKSHYPRAVKLFCKALFYRNPRANGDPAQESDGSPLSRGFRIRIRLDNISGLQDTSNAKDGVVQLTLPDYEAKTLLDHNLNIIKKQNDKYYTSGMALQAIDAYFKDTNDYTGVKNYSDFTNTFNAKQQAITPEECKKYSEALLKDLEGAKYQDHFALIFAKAALEKTITLANAPAIKKK